MVTFSYFTFAGRSTGRYGCREKGDLQYWGIEDVIEWTLDFQGPALDVREVWSGEENTGNHSI